MTFMVDALNVVHNGLNRDNDVFTVQYDISCSASESGSGMLIFCMSCPGQYVYSKSFGSNIPTSNGLT